MTIAIWIFLKGLIIMDKELWRPMSFSNIANGYFISSYGNIKTMDCDDPMIKYHSSNGYDFVKLLTTSGDQYWGLNARYFPIDELVAFSFMNIPSNLVGKQVTIRHINNDTRDSHIENLEIIEDIEEWKTVTGFDDYMISNHGQVKSQFTNAILSSHLNSAGYLRVSLNQHKKRSIHRLLMLTFCPIVDSENFQVNHIDENKLNNHLKNLEWVTPTENQNFGIKKMKTSKDKSKPVLCIETGIVYRSATEAAKLTGAQRTNIVECCNRKPQSTTGGYHWKFA